MPRVPPVTRATRPRAHMALSAGSEAEDTSRFYPAPETVWFSPGALRPRLYTDRWPQAVSVGRGPKRPGRPRRRKMPGTARPVRAAARTAPPRAHGNHPTGSTPREACERPPARGPSDWASDTPSAAAALRVSDRWPGTRARG